MGASCCHIFHGGRTCAKEWLSTAKRVFSLEIVNLLRPPKAPADLVAEYLAGGSHPPVGLWFARRTGGLYGNPVEVMTVDVPLPAFLMRERVFTVDNSIDDGLLTMSVFVLSVERVL